MNERLRIGSGMTPRVRVCALERACACACSHLSDMLSHVTSLDVGLYRNRHARSPGSLAPAVTRSSLLADMTVTLMAHPGARAQ